MGSNVRLECGERHRESARERVWCFWVLCDFWVMVGEKVGCIGCIQGVGQLTNCLGERHVGYRASIVSIRHVGLHG